MLSDLYTCYKIVKFARNEDKLFADVQTWFDKCRSLNCASEYECFLRRPENNCLDSWCTHMPDCMFTIGNLSVRDKILKPR